MKQEKSKTTKSSFDGLTPQDWVEMFNSEAEKSGLPTRATVKNSRTTMPTVSEKPLGKEK